MVKQLTLADARHLVSRTGLGADWETIQRLQGRTREHAVNYIVRPHSPHTPKPPRMTSWDVRQKMYESENIRLKMDMYKRTVVEGDRLKQWWLNHMLETRSPLIERMTLFWHGHFTSSLDKIRQVELLYKQNQMLRRNSLGNFAHMLKAVAKDPAMTVYLDGYMNEKNSPNENFARELLELFTVGRGHYSEADVKQVARAFTGWSVDRFKMVYIFNRKEHDEGIKTVLGKPARTGDDVIRILLEHPRTAMTIAEKFWNYFVSDAEPEQRYTQQWAKAFRQSGYEISILLKEVLKSEPFWSEKYRGTLTKSPADLLVGTLRTLPYRPLPAGEMVGILRLMGQDLFDPPNVKGWDGGYKWVDSQTLMVRTSLLSKLSRGNMNARVNGGKGFPEVSNEALRDWLLPRKPVTQMPTIPGKPRLVRALILDPVYQLT